MSSRVSKTLIVCAVALALVASACSSDGEGDTGDTAPTAASPTPRAQGAEITVTSPDFEDGGPIPEKYSAAGENINPALAWSGVPDGTQQLVLIMDDPDAPGGAPFVHWVVYGIDASASGAAEGEVPAGGNEGTNSRGDTSYFGPAPPVGPAHRYVFKVFAVSESVDIPGGATADDVMAAIDAKTTATGELTGTFQSS